MIEGSMDTILYSRVLGELGIPVDKPSAMNSDNIAAIEWGSGVTMPYRRSKHIDIAVHFIRELVRDGKITVPYVTTDKNASDGMTKTLQNIALEKMIDMFWMVKVIKIAEEKW